MDPRICLSGLRVCPEGPEGTREEERRGEERRRDETGQAGRARDTLPVRPNANVLCASAKFRSHGYTYIHMCK